MINLVDKSKAITAEDLIRRYNLEGLKSDRRNLINIRGTLDKQYNIIKDFVRYITPYKGQSDIMSVWFFDGVPTLENRPFIDFTESEKNASHLYYDRQTGFVYNLIKDNSTYLWEKVDDDNLIKSLALANGEADTGDGGRKMFFSTPATPYEIGDVWLDGNVIRRCRCARSEGEYNEADWVDASDYSNDFLVNDNRAVINQFKEDVQTTYATKVQLETTKESIIGRVELEAKNIKGTYDGKLLAVDKTISEVKVDITGINSTVTNMKTSYDGRLSTMSSQISQNASSISLKLNSSSFNSSAVISLINNRGSSSAKIDADNIDLSGKTINLTSDSIKIDSTNFKVDSAGNVTMKNANVNGTFEQYSSSSQKLAIGIKDHQVQLFDWEGTGQLCGCLGSVREHSANRIPGVSLWCEAGKTLSLGYRKSGETQINSILKFDTNSPNKTPWIINTVSGTLFNSPSYSGIVVENGLIKNWSLPSFEAEFDIGGAIICVKNGLIYDWRSTS